MWYRGCLLGFRAGFFFSSSSSSLLRENSYIHGYAIRTACSDVVTLEKVHVRDDPHVDVFFSVFYCCVVNLGGRALGNLESLSVIKKLYRLEREYACLQLSTGYVMFLTT